MNLEGSTARNAAIIKPKKKAIDNMSLKRTCQRPVQFGGHSAYKRFRLRIASHTNQTSATNTNMAMDCCEAMKTPSANSAIPAPEANVTHQKNKESFIAHGHSGRQAARLWHKIGEQKEHAKHDA